MTDKTKFLNLDEIAAPEKTVKIGGKEYQVLDMTVENFIETTRATQSGKEATPDEQFEQAVKMLNRYIPDAPVDTFKRLTFEKLNVLMKFVTGELETDAGTPETAAESSGDASKK